jgi:hypothetical protein
MVGGPVVEGASVVSDDYQVVGSVDANERDIWKNAKQSPESGRGATYGRKRQILRTERQPQDIRNRERNESSERRRSPYY